MKVYLNLARCSLRSEMKKISSLITFRLGIGYTGRGMKRLMDVPRQVHDPRDRDRLVLLVRRRVVYNLVELDKLRHRNAALLKTGQLLDLTGDLSPEGVVVMPIALVIFPVTR